MSNITGPSGEPLNRYYAFYDDGGRGEEIFAENLEDAGYRANSLGNATDRVLKGIRKAAA